MKPPYALTAVVLIVLALVSGYYWGIESSTLLALHPKAELHLEATNEKIAALEKRVKDLETQERLMSNAMPSLRPDNDG